MKSILVSSLIGGGAISYAISYMTEPKPNAAMSVIYTQPQSASAWWWSQIMWWLIPVALLLFVFGGAFHLFGSAYTRLKYPAHRKLSVAEAKRDAGIYEVERERKSLQVGTALARAQEREAREMARYATTQPAIEAAPAAITLQQAISQSTERAWIVGQAAEVQPTPEGSKRAGQLLTFDYRTTHAAIIGGTGSGKTESTAMLMVAYARRYNLHPIILDGKEGIDWRAFDGVAEWHAMSVDTVVGQFEQLMSIFDKRWEWLQRNNLSTIYKASGKRPPTLFVIIEEFGSVWMMLDKSARADLAQKVDRLFRLGRATGIVLCLIDQAPEKWTPQMRGNAKFVTCYKLKGMVANAFNEYHVDRLPHVGVFSQDNIFYNAWHTAEQIDIRGKYPPLQHRYLTDTETSQPGKQESAGNSGYDDVGKAGNAPSQVVGKAGEGRESGKAYPDIRPIPPSLLRLYTRTRKWDDFCAGYYKFYDDAQQAELRRVMAHVAGEGKAPSDYTGEAFRQHHRWSPHGDRSKAVRVN